ncbi:MAG TPA: AzlC family ABC transporter permease [Thiolinea sp.]|nr:AzlC family ABC transporter permease [Thiolinea sp.]
MNRLQAMRFGAVSTIPMIVGGIPFGIIFGSLAMSYGLPVWVPIAMSSLVFAGSAQFVALGLMAAGAPAWVIISTTLIVNLRHLLYAADFIKYVRHLPMGWRAGLAFGLIDEVYAAVRPHYQSGRLSLDSGKWAYLGAILSFYLMWNICTLIGIVAGEMIPDMSSWGLEFAMVATFIGIITPYLRHWPYWSTFLCAGTLALLLHGLPNNLGMLLAALGGVAAGMLTERFSHRERQPATSGKAAEATEEQA